MKIVLATGNAGKLKEMQSLLTPVAAEIISQGELSIPDAVEDGLTFVENAIIKARHACKLSGLPAIADDSGLEVDALQGQPGIYSARYAGEPSNSHANIQKLLLGMKNIPTSRRTARFRCVIVYMKHEHDPSPIIGSGLWEGYVSEEQKGTGGFGYDPVFIDRLPVGILSPSPLNGCG